MKWEIISHDSEAKKMIISFKNSLAVVCLHIYCDNRDIHYTMTFDGNPQFCPMNIYNLFTIPIPIFSGEKVEIILKNDPIINMNDRIQHLNCSWYFGIPLFDFRNINLLNATEDERIMINEIIFLMNYKAEFNKKTSIVDIQFKNNLNETFNSQV